MITSVHSKFYFGSASPNVGGNIHWPTIQDPRSLGMMLVNLLSCIPHRYVLAFLQSMAKLIDTEDASKKVEGGSDDDSLVGNSGRSSLIGMACVSLTRCIMIPRTRLDPPSYSFQWPAQSISLTWCIMICDSLYQNRSSFSIHFNGLRNNFSSLGVRGRLFSGGAVTTATWSCYQSPPPFLCGHLHLCVCIYVCVCQLWWWPHMRR